MKLNIRVNKSLRGAALRDVIENRARFALTRLGPKLLSVSVSVGLETKREGGRVVCRVSGSLAGGGTLHARCVQAHPRDAVDLALDRFRRAAFRSLTRKRRTAPQVAMHFNPIVHDFLQEASLMPAEQDVA